MRNLTAGEAGKQHKPVEVGARRDRKFAARLLLMVGSAVASGLMATGAPAQVLDLPPYLGQVPIVEAMRHAKEVAVRVEHMVGLPDCLDNATVEKARAEIDEVMLPFSNDLNRPEMRRLSRLRDALDKKCPPPLYMVGTLVRPPSAPLYMVGTLVHPRSDGMGFYLGSQYSAWTGRLDITEVFLPLDLVTGEFSQSSVSSAPGIVGGFKIAPFGNNIYLGGSVSVDFLNQTLNQTFSNGFLGTNASLNTSFLGEAGLLLAPGVTFGVQAGPSVKKEKANIFFAGMIPTSQELNVWGVTAGVNAAFELSMFQNLTRFPVWLTVGFQHTSWQDVNLTGTATLPLFTEKFATHDDVVKVGVNIYVAPIHLTRSYLEEGLR